MMNPEVKARWVAALRSGEYRQGREVLKDGNAFCCLGVLCDLYRRELRRKPPFYSICDSYDEVPGPEVCIWAALPSADPRVRIGGKNYKLSRHNDGGGYPQWGRTFSEIADAIEAQL